MKTNKLVRYLIGALLGIVLYQIISSSFSNPGLAKWEGKYEEIGYFRNENNTGPVVRLMAVRILDPNPTWMKEFADAQPHSKYGRTHVFFFSEGVLGKIQLTPTAPYFAEGYRMYLLATYEKTPMGESRFSYSNP